MNVSQRKEELRRRLNEKRGRLEPSRRERLSRRACSHVRSMEAFVGADCVLFYYPLEEELDLRFCFEEARERGIDMAFPLVNQRTDQLDLYRVNNPERQLREGAYQVMEPSPDTATRVEPATVDLALTPGLAFDRRGNRLGFGKGYYDRLLGRFDANTDTAGVGYYFQLIERVPVEEHDRSVQFVVTERGVHEAG